MTTKVRLPEFYRAVKAGAEARDHKSPLPVLTGILVRRTNEHIEVVSTDMVEHSRGQCQVGGESETWETVILGPQPGSQHILAQWLKCFDPTTKAMRNEVVELEFTERIQTLTVRVGRIRANFLTLDAGEFPAAVVNGTTDMPLKEKSEKPRGKRNPIKAQVNKTASQFEKALKRAKKMSAEAEKEHWLTFREVFTAHGEEIDRRLADLEIILERDKKAEEEYRIQELEREEEEQRLDRFAVLDPIRASIRAEFESGLRRDKIAELRQPIERWPFQGETEGAEYQTSYDWLEAVWVWNGSIFIRPRRRIYRWQKQYLKSVNGYEVTPKQIAYAEFLEKHMREAIQEINNAEIQLNQR